MESSWKPIVNGDISEVPRDKYVFFTVLNEKTGEVYTASGKVDEFCLQHYKYVFANGPVRCKALKAWMELPEPYEPGSCDMCEHNEPWTDCFGDRWAQCEFWPEYKSEDCPFKKED